MESQTCPGVLDAGCHRSDLRHSTWFIQSTTYGRIWVGLTDQASERITEINLANTNNFLKHYGRWNGSVLLRLPDGRLSTNTWGQILPQSGARVRACRAKAIAGTW